MDFWSQCKLIQCLLSVLCLHRTPPEIGQLPDFQTCRNGEIFLTDFKESNSLLQNIIANMYVHHWKHFRFYTNYTSNLPVRCYARTLVGLWKYMCYINNIDQLNELSEAHWVIHTRALVGPLENTFVISATLTSSMKALRGPVGHPHTSLGEPWWYKSTFTDVDNIVTKNLIKRLIKEFIAF